MLKKLFTAKTDEDNGMSGLRMALHRGHTKAIEAYMSGVASFKDPG